MMRLARRSVGLACRGSRKCKGWHPLTVPADTVQLLRQAKRRDTMAVRKRTGKPRPAKHARRGSWTMPTPLVTGTSRRSPGRRTPTRVMARSA